MTGFLYGHQGKRRKLKRAAGRIFRKMREMVIYALLVLIGLFLCSPVLLLLSGSITGDYELTQALKPALLEGSGFISWDFIPEFPTFASFRKLLFYSPQFFMLFWNSIKMVLLILAGQLSVPGKKVSVYHLYCADADAFSGDHAFLLSGTGQTAYA